MPVPQLRDVGVVRLGYAGAVAARILTGYKTLDTRKNRMSDDEYDRRVRRHHEKSARRIYRGVLRLQGLMIKIGQTLGSRPDLLPQEYVQTLSRLQDRVPPHPFRDRGAGTDEALVQRRAGERGEDLAARRVVVPRALDRRPSPARRGPLTA